MQTCLSILEPVSQEISQTFINIKCIFAHAVCDGEDFEKLINKCIILSEEEGSMLYTYVKCENLDGLRYRNELTNNMDKFCRLIINVTDYLDSKNSCLHKFYELSIWVTNYTELFAEKYKILKDSYDNYKSSFSEFSVSRKPVKKLSFLGKRNRTKSIVTPRSYV